jgi:hypothetical protein
MIAATTEDRTPLLLRCPTCGAEQEWADQCRRCKCDVTLLGRVARAAQAQRRRCLVLLRAGRVDEALRHAERLHSLTGEPRAARLLAVCRLLDGNWPGALAAARAAK